MAGDNSGTTEDMSYATVAGGSGNTASGTAATVGGGANNEASGNNATVAGGTTNTATQGYATVGGGYLNDATALAATVAGGYDCNATGSRSTVPGGSYCDATGDNSFAAGTNAKAANNGAFVWADNQTYNYTSGAINEFNVRANGGVHLVTGSVENTGETDVTHGVEFTQDGARNIVNALGADPLEVHLGGARVLRLEPDVTSPRIIGGHSVNSATGIGATVAGGGEASNPNQAIGDYSAIGGGRNNTANAPRTAIAGGTSNSSAAGAEYAAIGGGNNTGLYRRRVVEPGRRTRHGAGRL
jgi:hypothetical protein